MHRLMLFWAQMSCLEVKVPLFLSYPLRAVNQPWKRSSNPESGQSRFFSVLCCDEKIRNLFEGLNGTLLGSNDISLSRQGWTCGLTDHHALGNALRI